MYSSTYYLNVYLQDDNCDELVAACEDGTYTMYYFTVKLAIAEVMAYWIAYYNTGSWNSDLSFGTNYYSSSYDPEDDWEEGDLEFYATYFSGCTYDDDFYYFVQDQLGVFGPSVYNLMLLPNSYYEEIEEIIALTNGDDNVFESRRRLERDESAMPRQLAGSKTFWLSFGTSTNYPDAFDIATTLDITPVVEVLSASTMVLSLVTLCLALLHNLF
jgi:hypothetical protein